MDIGKILKGYKGEVFQCKKESLRMGFRASEPNTSGLEKTAPSGELEFSSRSN